MTKRQRPLLISFSGLDGAGKSTQIANLRATLAQLGLRDSLFAFWDDVVVLVRYREGFVHKVYKSERGIGAPGKPVHRRDKNVRHWYLSLLRHGLYFLDALNLSRVVAKARRGTGPGGNDQGPPDVIILDRYIYDELANLPLGNPLSRLFCRIVHAIAPRPDIAYLLDADPEAAHARKPEYPVQFMRESRERYFALARLLRTITVIPPLPLEEAKAAVVDVLRKRLEAGQAGLPTPETPVAA